MAGHSKQHPPKTGAARRLWDMDDDEVDAIFEAASDEREVERDV